MPFARPTLTELRQRAKEEFKVRLPGSDPFLRFSNEGIAAEVLAGLSHMHYGYIDFLARNIILDTADADILARHAAIWGVLRKAGAKAAGTVLMSGTDGLIVDAGTLLRTGDGREYETTEAVELDGETEVAVEAVETGVDGNQAAGATASFVVPQAGVNVDTLVAAPGFGGGTDDEDVESWRTRLLLHIQSPPQGGAKDDYRQWTLAVPGVTRAWVYPNELGLGSVTVRFMMDEARAAFDGIPQGAGYPAYGGDLLAVYNYIEELRPVTADVRVVPPIAVPLDLTITGLNPDTPAIRAAIEAEFAAMLRRDAEPGGTIYRSRIWEAVSLASGEKHHAVTVPAADVTHTAGQIAVPGDITFA